MNHRLCESISAIQPLIETRFKVPVALALILGLAACSTPPTRIEETSNAEQFAMTYSRHVLNRDTDAMIALAHKPLVAHVGGAEKMSAIYKEGLANSSWPAAEKFDRTELCNAGNVRVALTRTTRTLKLFQGSRELRHNYLMISADGGNSWEMIDQSCTSGLTIKMIAPEISREKCNSPLFAEMLSINP
jgi:hypothetical protein